MSSENEFCDHFITDVSKFEMDDDANDDLTYKSDEEFDVDDIDDEYVNVIDLPIGFSHLESSPHSRPLGMREVEVLKMGMELAVKTRSPDIIREECEERLDAEVERESRNSVISGGDHSMYHVNDGTAIKRFKILMLGDSGVGKSSLMIRWTADSFSTDLVGTVGVNFKTKKENINGEWVQAQVWDTAGQEQFHKITTSYYKGAHGIVLVYDVSDPKSWENIQYWVKKIKSYASESVQVVLVGNKVDLRDEISTSIQSSTGISFSKKCGVPFFETSAKNAINVSAAFHLLLGNIMAVHDAIEMHSTIHGKRFLNKEIHPLSPYLANAQQHQQQQIIASCSSISSEYYNLQPSRDRFISNGNVVGIAPGKDNKDIDIVPVGKKKANCAIS